MMGGGARRDRKGGENRPDSAEAQRHEGSASHIPVLLGEVLAHLQPADGKIYLDATFGAGGYSKAILEAADCRVVAIDRDPDAIAAAAPLLQEFAPRLSLHQARFSQMREVAAAATGERLDGIVLDIGLSSMQLDQGARGFSFQKDGPLDMRMGGKGATAAEVLATTDESDIADILYYLGDERRSRAIARAIVKARDEQPLQRTGQLAALVARVLGQNRTDPKHPATRTFQGLRIYVNDELGELSEALRAAEQLLQPGGRLVVVTFHSLEDRIVKRFLVSRTGTVAAGSRHLPPSQSQEMPPSFQFINRRPVSPDKNETEVNPRARSAKLRAARRTDAPAWKSGDMVPDVPRLGPQRKC